MLIKINQTLKVTAVLLTGMVLLGLSMAEGLLQEKRGGTLRGRQLDQGKISPARINLPTAGNFAVLTKLGVTTTSLTTRISVTGDIGTSPITAAALTGFDLIVDPSGCFSTSTFVKGGIYGPDYVSPTPSMLTTAVQDMEAAYIDAEGCLEPDHTELGDGSIEGLTLVGGLYKWGTGVGFTSSVTFDGTATDIWILQIAGVLTVGSGARVYLTGGAKAENIFW